MINELEFVGVDLINDFGVSFLQYNDYEYFYYMIKGVNKSMLSATTTGLASGTASPSTGVSTVAGSASSSTACRGSQKDKVTVPTDVPALSPGDFRLETLIGEGLNGKVYHEKLNTGENVALKMLDVFTEAESSNEFLTKVSRVATLQHDNLVKLRGYCDEENNPFLAYEYATKGSLHDMLHGRKGVNGAQPGPVLDWIQRVKIALDAAKGLEYLHQNVKPHIVHGDIRSNNVLLFEGLSAKIADFDFSIRAPDLTVHFNSTGALGTSCYHAPEYAMTKLLTPKTDVYSFGLLLLEILTGRKCDQDDDTMPQGQQSLLTRVRRMLRKGIVEQCVDPSLEEYSLKGVAQMAQLAAACVMDTPEVRPSMGIVVMRLENILTAPTGT
ncbi:PTI1-like tyrosine-protein kinase 2, partial [Rutidosis leptorrhynchoides]|uniref:PTI1-like tyrosine-protein kinase 2 n=1 Tax=Rutidosis leptorrhynchoides TaxID=125765 RepID=UPI003A997E5A